MTVTDRIRAAWSALRNDEPAGLLLPSAGSSSLERGLFDGGAINAGGGLLASVLQQGQAPRRGTEQLLRSYREMPWLRAVIDRIAVSVASTEWRLYRRRGDEKVEIKEHPVLSLLDTFNPSMTGRAAWHLIESWIDLKGEAFLIVERNGAGVPVELWPIPPHWIAETPSASKPFFEVTSGAFKKSIPEADMLWLRIHDPENPYGRGVGVAESLADELDTDEYASKHTKAWFYNRAVPDILVGVKGASEPQLKRAKQIWENGNRGAQRAHKSHWHSGELTVETLSQTFSDMQLIELREFERNAIVQAFGVPPEILGIIENSNRSTIDAASFIFSLWVVQPRLDFLRSELNFRLLPSFGSDLFLDYDSPVPADKALAVEVLKTAPHVLTVDEIRDLIDYAELGEDDGGDVYATNVSTVFVDSMEQGAGDESVRARRRDANAAGTGDGGDGTKAATVTKALTPGEVDLVADALEPIIMTSLVDPEVEKMIRTFGQAAISEVGLSASFSMLSPIVVEHIVTRSAVLVSNVTATTRDAIRRALFEGVLAGDGPRRLASRIKEVFAEASRARATMIARTEVNTSANFARWQGMAQSGLVVARRWLTARDSRVRDQHRFLNNKTAGINDPFNVGGFSAMHPGGFSVARLDVNCRCTTIPVIAMTDEVSEPDGDGQRDADDAVIKGPFDADAEIDVLDEYADRLFAEMQKWEDSIAVVVRKALAQQSLDVLDALERLAR